MVGNIFKSPNPGLFLGLQVLKASIQLSGQFFKNYNDIPIYLI